MTLDNWRESERIRNKSLEIWSELLTKELSKGNEQILMKFDSYEKVMTEMIVHEMNELLKLIKLENDDVRQKLEVDISKMDSCLKIWNVKGNVIGLIRDSILNVMKGYHEGTEGKIISFL
jgi:hypothetical protein